MVHDRYGTTDISANRANRLPQTERRSARSIKRRRVYTVIRATMAALVVAVATHLAWKPRADGSIDAIILAFAVVMIALTFGVRTQRT
jgi:acid phosphatase family membrane protein YuiD